MYTIYARLLTTRPLCPTTTSRRFVLIGRAMIFLSNPRTKTWKKKSTQSIKDRRQLWLPVFSLSQRYETKSFSVPAKNIQFLFVLQYNPFCMGMRVPCPWESPHSVQQRRILFLFSASAAFRVRTFSAASSSPLPSIARNKSRTCAAVYY